jgi:hypothetical protein
MRFTVADDVLDPFPGLTIGILEGEVETARAARWG